MLLKSLGMYIFYTSQGIAMIDVLSSQLFDLLKDGTKNTAEGGKSGKSCQASKLVYLKKKKVSKCGMLLDLNGFQ